MKKIRYLVKCLLKFVKRIKIKPFFRWYDLWIGIFIDTKNKCVYIIPIPTLGLKISLKEIK